MQPTRKTTLSYSSLELFNSCERKFQHRKLLRSEAPPVESSALSNGRAVDAGYGKYLETRNTDLSTIDTWMEYFPLLEDTVRSPAKAQAAVDALIAITPPTWDIFTLPNGRPATQIAFNIHCGDQYDYIGFVDAICQDRNTQDIIPVEVKTTSAYARPALIYTNSTQALVYAFITMAATGKLPQFIQYTYMIAHMPRAKGKLPEGEMLVIDKTIKDVLQWLITLKLDIEKIDNYRELEFFPKRNACNAWNRECEFFGICDLTSQASARPLNEHEQSREGIKFDFEFELDDLIALALKAAGSM